MSAISSVSLPRVARAILSPASFVRPRRVKLKGGAYSVADMYLAGRKPDAVYQLAKPDVNECWRAMSCTPICDLDEAVERDVACGLGTYGCTETHGFPQDGMAEDLRTAIRRYPYPSRRFRDAQSLLAAREEGYE
jgi:hypothetical protein